MKPIPVTAAALLAAGLALPGCTQGPESILPLLAGESAPRAAAGLQLRAPAADPGPEVRQPLIVIRFAAGDPRFAWPLYREVARALESDPNLRLDLVAVAPPEATGAIPAETARRAETVLDALTAMGFPAGRVRLTATTGAGVAATEVHVYVR